MTMRSGSSERMNSEINVTPMIDVLLVLLIIFMVISPAIPRGESAKLPAPAKGHGAGDDAVVLEVLKTSGGQVGFRINQQDVAPRDLAARLAAVYANRAERVLFVEGDPGLSFTEVAQAIDIGHAAGVDRIGLLTPKMQAGL